MIPVALTIAGSDNSAGAGIQADLKTFSALGVFGTTILTCVVAENPRTVANIQPMSSRMVKDQLTTVTDYFPVTAAKTGMLFNREIIATVSTWLKKSKIPTVVDPVMISTSGSVLLKPDSIKSLKRDILPRAALVTPNLDEAVHLTGRRISTPVQLRETARALYEEYGVPFLIKGGHLRGKFATDILFDGRREYEFTVPYIRGLQTHGTGCTYSAAITAGLARGYTLVRAVTAAKKYITAALHQSHDWGQRRMALNHFNR